MLKFLIVDDHPLFRDALRGTIGQTFTDATILEASSVDEGISTADSHDDIDLVLFDLSMPGMQGFSGLLSLRTRFPKLPVVVISALDDERIVNEAISHGAIGFIPKSSPKPELTSALKETIAGNVYVPPDMRGNGAGDGKAKVSEKDDLSEKLGSLTPQQLRVLQLLGTGKLNKEIAYELDIAETTVKAHVSAILRKLNVYSRTQAVIVARKLQFEEILGGPDTQHGGEFPSEQG